MSKAPKMVIINNRRYRDEDARRLGLVTDGKVVTARSRERSPEGEGAGLVTSAAQGAPEQPEQLEQPERPTNGASRELWAAYAVAQGADAEEVQGLGRDAIRSLFPEQD